MTLDQFKGLVGDIHRPVTLLLIGVATAYAIFARSPEAIFAAGGLLALLFGARGLENYGVARVVSRSPAPPSSDPPVGGGL